MDRYPADCGQSSAEAAEAAAQMISDSGIYIEDYSDLEQQVAEIAHVDLIEQELLDKPRTRSSFTEPGASPVETLAQIAAGVEAVGIPYTVETQQYGRQNGSTQILPSHGDRQPAGGGALLGSSTTPTGCS